MVWTSNWTTKVQNDQGVRWRAISSKTELIVEARWGLQDWLGKHAVVKIKGGIRLQHHRERPSQDTPVGMVLVASLHASFQRRILGKPLEKEGPVIDGVEYSNLLSAMFKKDSSCFRTCYSSNLPDESCVIICTISWFGKAFTGTKAYLMWKFFNSEAYYSYYYCFFLLSFHPSLLEEHWIGNHVPKWQEYTMY